MTKYFFDRLSIGESLIYDVSERRRILSAANRHKERTPGWDYRVRAINETREVSITRIEPMEGVGKKSFYGFEKLSKGETVTVNIEGIEHKEDTIRVSAGQYAKKRGFKVSVHKEGKTLLIKKRE